MQSGHEDIDTFKIIMFTLVVGTSDFSITVIVIGVQYSYIPLHVLSSDLLAGYSVMNMLSNNRHITVLPPDM
jgi:hypothetical protein